jgi:hypothetical protein
LGEAKRGLVDHRSRENTPTLSTSKGRDFSVEANNAPPGTKNRTPILPAVAYPTHLLYVPPSLWGVNLAFATTVGFIVGLLDGSGLHPELIIAQGVLTHIYLIFKYRRDPFVAKVWAAYLQGKPLAPWSCTKNLRRPGRLVSVFE